LSERERISNHARSGNLIGTQQQVTLVRPDGLIFYESSLNSLEYLQASINQNFHFLSTTPTFAKGDAIYEEAI
jgi:hypothetical protein